MSKRVASELSQEEQQAGSKQRREDKTPTPTFAVALSRAAAHLTPISRPSATSVATPSIALFPPQTTVSPKGLPSQARPDSTNFGAASSNTVPTNARSSSSIVPGAATHISMGQRHHSHLHQQHPQNLLQGEGSTIMEPDGSAVGPSAAAGNSSISLSHPIHCPSVPSSIGASQASSRSSLNWFSTLYLNWFNPYPVRAPSWFAKRLAQLEQFGNQHRLLEEKLAAYRLSQL